MIAKAHAGWHDLLAFQLLQKELIHPLHPFLRVHNIEKMGTPWWGDLVVNVLDSVLCQKAVELEG